jgi:RNA polymerase sigma-70 factor (sigma-E family)
VSAWVGDGTPVPRAAPPAALTVADRDRPGTTPARGLDDVVRAHLPGLVRYATVLVGDEHTGADLVQEVLLRAHQRWTRIGLMERPDLYLRRMVTNEHLSWRRRWHVRTIRPAGDDVLAAHATAERDHAAGLVEEDAMWRRLAGLPARQRTVLVLRYYEGLDDVEIAAVLGTSAATVRSHASRALAALRRTGDASGTDGTPDVSGTTTRRSGTTDRIDAPESR